MVCSLPDDIQSSRSLSSPAFAWQHNNKNWRSKPKKLNPSPLPRRASMPLAVHQIPLAARFYWPVEVAIHVPSSQPASTTPNYRVAYTGG